MGLYCKLGNQNAGVATYGEQCNLHFNSTLLYHSGVASYCLIVLSKLCPVATQMPFPVLAMLPLTVNSTPFLFKGQGSAQSSRDLRRQQSLFRCLFPVSRFSISLFFVDPTSLI